MFIRLHIIHFEKRPNNIFYPLKIFYIKNNRSLIENNLNTSNISN